MQVLQAFQRYSLLRVWLTPRFVAASGLFQFDRINDRDLGQLGLSGRLIQEQQGLDPPPCRERETLYQFLKSSIL